MLSICCGCGCIGKVRSALSQLIERDLTTRACLSAVASGGAQTHTLLLHHTWCVAPIVVHCGAGMHRRARLTSRVPMVSFSASSSSFCANSLSAVSARQSHRFAEGTIPLCLATTAQASAQRHARSGKRKEGRAWSGLPTSLLPLKSAASVRVQLHPICFHFVPS